MVICRYLQNGIDVQKRVKCAQLQEIGPPISVKSVIQKHEQTLKELHANDSEP